MRNLSVETNILDLLTVESGLIIEYVNNIWIVSFRALLFYINIDKILTFYRFFFTYDEKRK